LAEIGQTHAILRFLDQQHNSASKRDPLHRATIDAFVENVRDVRSAWYKAKSTGSKHEFLIHDLSEWCRKLEDSLPLKETIETPWLIGDYLSLADIALYAMLAAPVSLMTGSSQSFFDGASSELIQDAYNDCHRLQQSMAAMAKLPVVRQWEDRRPDTFN
jgi:glutathione S-transferase